MDHHYEGVFQHLTINPYCNVSLLQQLASHKEEAVAAATAAKDALKQAQAAQQAAQAAAPAAGAAGSSNSGIVGLAAGALLGGAAVWMLKH